MLKVLFTQDSEAEDPLCGAPSGSEPSLFFSLGFEPVQYDFQHDFTRMTDEADGSKVLATRAIGSLFREFINQRLSPWDRPFSCFPDLVTDLCQNPCLHEQVRLVYYQLLQIFPFSVKLQGSQLSQSGLAVTYVSWSSDFSQHFKHYVMDLQYAWVMVWAVNVSDFILIVCHCDLYFMVH